MKRELLFAAGFFTLGSPAYAAVIDSAASGLAAPESTVTFSEQTFPEFTAITDQFANVGVTFTPNLFYRLTSAWEPSGINDINLRSGDPIANPFSIHFTQSVSSAAFASIASPVTAATITARLNGVDVESFTTEVNLAVESWYGFTGIVFDEIEVNYAEVTRLRIDNIQFVTIPEPGTIALASLGLLGIIVRRRRRE